MFGVVQFGQKPFGDPVLAVSATISASKISVTTSVKSVTISAGASVSPSVISKSTTRYTPTISAGVTVSVSVISKTTTRYSPTLSAGETASPSSRACTSTFNAPTISTGVLLSASPISESTTRFTPTIAAGATVSPSAQSRSATFYNPNIIANLGATVQPAVIPAGTYGDYANGYQGGSSSSRLWTPVISTGASVSPSLIVVSSTTYSPAIIAVTSALPGDIAVIATMVDPAVSDGRNTTVGASRIPVDVTFRTADISVGSNPHPARILVTSTRFSVSLSTNSNIAQGVYSVPVTFYQAGGFALPIVATPDEINVLVVVLGSYPDLNADSLTSPLQAALLYDGRTNTHLEGGLVSI